LPAIFADAMLLSPPPDAISSAAGFLFSLAAILPPPPFRCLFITLILFRFARC